MPPNLKLEVAVVRLLASVSLSVWRVDTEALTGFSSGASCGMKAKSDRFDLERISFSTLGSDGLGVAAACSTGGR
jgi:hypothetical protein